MESNSFIYQYRLLIYLCSYLQYHVLGAAISATYSATHIIQDQDTCDWSTKLSSSEAISRIQCGQFCSSDAECRRFLYCDSSSTCSLYLDGADCVVDGDSTGCLCFQKDSGCIGSTCTCPWGRYGNQCQNIIQDCSDGVLNHGVVRGKVTLTHIKPVTATESFEVECLLDWGGWTTILHRFLYCQDVSFNRSLAEYEVGFGEAPLNRWLGFDKILQILGNPSAFALVLDIMYTDYWSRCRSYYRNFGISKNLGYEFTTSGYDTDALTPCGDSFLPLVGNKFSTYDADFTSTGCSSSYGGGWWFDLTDPDCSRSFLTGTLFADNFWKDSLDGQPIKNIQLTLKRM